MLPPQYEHDEDLATRDEAQAKKPPLFKVLLHNDDYTTMDFVVYVLQAVFHMSHEDAYRVMLNVHLRGVGVAGTYTYEIAEMKVSKVAALAQAHEYPLLATLEEA